jgi:hypothetical protein
LVVDAPEKNLGRSGKPREAKHPAILAKRKLNEKKQAKTNSDVWRAAQLAPLGRVLTRASIKGRDAQARQYRAGLSSYQLEHLDGWLDSKLEATTMRGLILWLLGVPISIIILLYLFHVI